MSVLMTFRVSGDGDKLTEYAQGHQEELQGIIGKAKNHGLISHRFFASSDEVLVVDEWPDEASFRAFFAQSPEIQNMMTAAGAREEPVVTFWRQLDTGDEVRPGG